MEVRRQERGLSRLSYVQADLTDARSLLTGSFAAVVDKGTLDAILSAPEATKVLLDRSSPVASRHVTFYAGLC